MRRLPRWLLFTAIVVVLALTGLAGLSVATVRRPFPELDGQLVLPGLSGPVEVLRDAYGVPQIYADGAEDLFEAQGYVHAQDRFYEMDVRRHITAGRLSELFGDSQLDTDIYLRTLGWRRVAEQELPLLSSRTRRYLDAYASGVNTYLRGRSAADLALEYSVLSLQSGPYTPEDWTAVDSLAWLKAMAWDLGSNLDQETELAIMTGKVGAQRAHELFPPYPHAGFDPIVPGGTVVDGAFDPEARGVSGRPAPAGLSETDLRAAESAFRAAGGVTEALQPWLKPAVDGGELGSNSWVVSGERTASGKAILSNDQHLSTSIPSIYAQVGLHCRRISQSCPFEVSGFSFAGMPGVITGHNASIAWGFTTSYVDVQDLYLEEVNGNVVRVGDGYEPLEVRTEQVKVNGEDQPRTITVRTSRHGPLLSDASAELRDIGAQAGQPGYAVALAWTALKPSRAMDALFAMNQAQDFTQARAASELLAAPSQNLVYADVAGNIGYQLTGVMPERGRGDGVTPSPGWDTAYDWAGLVPFAEMPYLYNPPSGFIVAANQPVIGRQYPHRIGSTYSYGWRSQQLRDVLEAAPPLTNDLAAQLFYDDTIRFAAELVPVLLKVNVADSWVAEGQKTLVGWDYRAGADSAAAAYFNVVFHDLLKRTFRDEMPEGQWPSGGDRWFAVVATLLDQPNNKWWDDTTTPHVVERRDDILLAAMTDARKEITSLMARDTDEWQWGRLHRITLRNQTLGTSGIAPIERLFNRGDYPAAGGSAVVLAYGFDLREGYSVSYGPTERMLVDLGNLDQSRWVNQSGVSGHAFHPNYDDQTELWATNQLWPFVFSRAEVDKITKHRLELSPPS